MYEDQTRTAGLDRLHGLRHAPALDRYEELTGWAVPAAGGPPRRRLTGVRERIDATARQRISRKLGHERREMVSHYCG